MYIVEVGMHVFVQSHSIHLKEAYISLSVHIWWETI